jgi:hypothetical protein
MGVYIVRISSDSELAFNQLDKFKQQLQTPIIHPLDSKNECNGFWHKIAGMSVA